MKEEIASQSAYETEARRLVDETWPRNPLDEPRVKYWRAAGRTTLLVLLASMSTSRSWRTILRHSRRAALSLGTMAKRDSLYETTAKGMQGEDGVLRFARPRAIRNRLRELVLPILWLLATVVLVAAVWWIFPQ